MTIAGSGLDRSASCLVQGTCASYPFDTPEQGRSFMLFNFHGAPIPLADCRFFFIFCPNNSGKTILSQYLATQLGAYLPPTRHHEGQALPGARKLMRFEPWNPDSHYDWPAIRALWEDAAKGQLFVEASPPNLMRPEAIKAQFGHDSTALVSICNPYQQIASSLKRYKKPGANVGGMVNHWLLKARNILTIRQTYPQFPLIRYEDFVAAPFGVNDALGLPPVEFAGVGKRGSGAEGLQDLSIRTTLFLNLDEIGTISRSLAAHTGLLDQFGYHITDANALVDQARSAAPAEYALARTRRAEWDATADPAP